MTGAIGYLLREIEGGHPSSVKALIAIDKRNIRVLDVQRLADYGSH